VLADEPKPNAGAANAMVFLLPSVFFRVHFPREHAWIFYALAHVPRRISSHDARDHSARRKFSNIAELLVLIVMSICF